MTEKSSDDTKAGPSFTFWFVLCLATSVATLVNQVEQPFARSIVSCETPVDITPGSPKPLSQWCGDRLYVIGEGARLSSKAQSLEYICKCTTIIVVGIGADIFGRKPLCIMAISAVTFSCLLFVWASFDPANAYWLFILAQGCQGLSGGEMLTIVLFSDLSFQLGAAATQLMVLKDQILGLTALLSFWVSTFVAALELTDYRGVWVFISMLNLCGLYTTIAVFPETMPAKKDNDVRTTSFGQAVMEEIGAFRNMLVDNPLIKWSLCEALLTGPQNILSPMFDPFMMSYFGYTQQMCIVRGIPLAMLPLLCMPLADNYCRKVGYTTGFIHLCLVMKTLSITLFPLTPLVWYLPWICKISYLPLSGLESIWTTVRNRIVGERMTAKYTSLQMLTHFLASSLSAQAYARLFDENATTFWGRATTAGFATVFNVLSILLWVFVLFAGVRPALEGMDKDLAAEKAKSEDAKKTE